MRILAKILIAVSIVIVTPIALFIGLLSYSLVAKVSGVTCTLCLPNHSCATGFSPYSRYLPSDYLGEVSTRAKSNAATEFCGWRGAPLKRILPLKITVHCTPIAPPIKSSRTDWERCQACLPDGRCTKSNAYVKEFGDSIGDRDLIQDACYIYTNEEAKSASCKEQKGWPFADEISNLFSGMFVVH